MTRRQNLFNNLLLFIATGVSIFFVAMRGTEFFEQNIVLVVLFFIIGAIIAALINTFAHETGHILAAKKQNFFVAAFRITFFAYVKKGKKFEFKFVPVFDEIGETELAPNSHENMEQRLKKVYIGGQIGSFILLALSVLPIVFAPKMSFYSYTLTAMLLPVSLYFILANLPPMISEGRRNDGAVLKSLKLKNDYAKNLLSILTVQGYLAEGKKYSEIEEDLLTAPPVLAEDEILYAVRKDLEFHYYLACKNYEKVNKILIAFDEQITNLHKYCYNQIAVDVLLGACTVRFNPEKADNYVEDFEKYLNKNNDIKNLFAKFAYLIYVCEDYEKAETFIEKAERDINKCVLKGEGLFYQDLLDTFKDDIKNKTNSFIK